MRRSCKLRRAGNEPEIKASSVKDITKATTPFDFEGKLKRYCFKLVK